MSRIENLLQEFCPEGVEFQTLGDVLDYEQPTKFLVDSADYSDGFGTPVLTAGQTFILGYTSETDGVYNASPGKPVIIFDDFTTAFKWVDFPFKAKSSAMKMLSAKSGSQTILRFVYFWMQSIGFSPKEHARHWISQYSTFKFPKLAIAVQEEIVRILDTFTELETELEAELEARKKQYDHYRKTLLSFPAMNVPWVAIAEVVTNLDSRRKPVTKSSREPGPYPYFGANGIQDYVAGYIFDETILMIGEDGSVIRQDGTPYVHWSEGKVWVNNHAHVLKEKDSKLNLRFLFHFMQTVQISEFVTGGSQLKINQGNLNKILIPLPEREVQDEIALQLDAFHEISQSLSSGLPAELEARRKQYEYYRDKLLTFKELAS